MNDRRRLLLLVTTQTYRAGAFVAASRALGLDLTVASERPQALAGFHPEGHLLLDFRDPGAALATIVAFARAHSIHAVIAADDECAGLAARAAERLGLGGHRAGAVSAARDKFLARTKFTAAGLPSPPCALVSTTAAEPPAEVGFPCVLKPRGLSASRGVIRADDRLAFLAAHRRIAGILAAEGPAGPDEPPRDSILVEGFLPGREVALEALIAGDELQVMAIFDKPDPLDGPYFEETMYVTPSRLSEATQREIVETALRSARALGLGPGPIHAEFRIGPGPGASSGEDRVWPLEIAPRSIGGLCSRAVRFERGESLETVVLRQALGDPSKPQPLGRASGVMMIPIPGPGRLRAAEGADEARSVAGVESVILSAPLGSELVPLPEGSRYLGFIFAEGETPERVEWSLREAHRRMRFEIDPPANTGEERRAS